MRLTLNTNPIFIFIQVRGSSGSSLTLHTSRLLQTSVSPPSCFVFLPDASVEIDEDDKDDEGEQCHSSIEL